MEDARAANCSRGLSFFSVVFRRRFARIRQGLIPQAMEDKWFIFFEEPWLYSHRSWTGACIYAVRFASTDAGFTAVESWVSRDTNQYKEIRTDYDRAVIGFLIDAMLLHRRVAFPVPTDLPSNVPAGLFQHSMVGRGYPEVRVNPSGDNPNVA